MKTANLGRRFFALTVLGYLAALASCVMVVWALSVPFVKSAKTQHLQDIANQDANAAAFMLDEYYDRVEYLARLPSVRELAQGKSDRLGDVSERVSTFRTPAFRHVKVFNDQGEPLFQSLSQNSADRLFADVEFREGFSGLARVSIGANRLGRIRLRRHPEEGHMHILIAVPVLVNGQMVGAVVLEKFLGPEDGLPGGADLVTAFQRELYLENANAVTAALPGLPLYVHLADTQSLMRENVSQAAELVARITLGLSLVLLLPFLAMSFFGAKHLVAPTQALARSRERMAIQQEQLKRQSEELRELAIVAELSSDSILVTDQDGKVIWVNNAFSKMTGYQQEDMAGKKPGRVLQGPGTDKETVARIGRALRNHEPVREEILNVKKSGEAHWITLSISPIMDESGVLQRFAAISSDVTERRAVQEKLAKAQREAEYRAMHDTLTGLPNRRYLDRVLDEEVASEIAPRTLIRIDLDFFKNVNDTHGHAAGDHVLRSVSDTLINQSRPEDLVARVGGDEFVVLLAAGSTLHAAKEICERYQSEIRKEIVFEGKTCRVGASFGVASAENGVIQNQELLIGADAALYLSKCKGRNATTLYTPEVHGDVLRKRLSAIEIERAIEREEFVPYFQPQMTASTRSFAGMEALVRWHHPENGILRPDAFLSLADQMSLVPEIDDIVYRKGLQVVQDLQHDGFSIPKISFNVGAHQLENPQLKKLNDDYDLGDTQIAFEVLESVLVEEQDAAFAFRVDLLRDLGFGIEIDDFGSGHASIVGLLHLRPDAMKLDQRLITPLTIDRSAVITVRSLVEIGQAQGIKITAEGVETEEQARILAELGVDTLQGYRFAKPLPEKRLRAFLAKTASDGPSVA